MDLIPLPPIIVKLPQSTIRMIAAGEVITRPYNVVKELVENSIDAGATNIRVSIEQGGLKSIEIVDNGHGIAKQNAPLLCERYTTSKLTSANDLTRLSTFGFRGEALASISEVARLEVKSYNMASDKIGWQGFYSSGRLVQAPVDKYQTPGTTISVIDLFSSIGPRRNNLVSNATEERKLIVDLLTKLAIHFRERITFILREKTGTDLVCSIAPVDLAPCLGGFYGSDMESNLFELRVKQSDSFDVDIMMGLTYKKSTSNLVQSNMILFVNNRLVECDELKREIGAMVLEYFSWKQFTTLSYISLIVPPQDVDVNTHPAKASVTLHFQQEIIGLILTELRSKLDSNLASQTVSSNVVQKKTNDTQGTTKRAHEHVHTDASQPSLSQVKIAPSRSRREINLCSIASLRMEVANQKCQELRNLKIIKRSIFVGILDHERALIQYDTKLYAINLKSYLHEQFYQFYLFDFGNFPPIEILPPGNKLRFMIETYLEHIKRYDSDLFLKHMYCTFDAVMEKLLEQSEMLVDYLSLRFTEQEVLSIPNVIPEHVPNLVFLGKFFVDIANNVDFSEEQACFRGLGRCLADFYSRPPHNLKDFNVRKRYHKFVETRLHEAIKKYLIPPDYLFRPDNICQITDTKDLYRVFERC